MKRFFIAAMVIVILTGCKDKATEFKISQGVNIGNWLSQSWVMGEQREKIFTEEDIELLAANGFDHIRLPVDEVQLFNTDMTLNESTVALIHRTIDCCIGHGLKVIFDLHILRSFHFLDDDAPLWKSTEEQDKLVNMWRDIQGILRDYPVTSVAYEILNEAVAPTDGQWSYLMLRVVSMIRETEKDRVIVLGANIGTTNDNTIYSSALGLSNITKRPKRPMVIVGGVIGTLASVWVYDHFINWLSILNILLPPVGAVIMIDFFCRRKSYLDEDYEESVINLGAVIGVVVGALVGGLFNYGINNINSMLAACLCYVLFNFRKIFLAGKADSQ